jgi:hypothetical protein
MSVQQHMVNVFLRSTILLAKVALSNGRKSDHDAFMAHICCGGDFSEPSEGIGTYSWQETNSRSYVRINDLDSGCKSITNYPSGRQRIGARKSGLLVCSNSRGCAVVDFLPQRTTCDAAYIVAQVLVPLHRLHSRATGDNTCRKLRLPFDNSASVRHT